MAHQTLQVQVQVRFIHVKSAQLRLFINAMSKDKKDKNASQHPAQ